MDRSIFVVAALLLAQQIMGDSSSELLVRSSNIFSNSLYKKLAEKPGNLLVCPLSLNIALGLVLQGAGNTTASELSAVLGFSDVNLDTKQSYKSLITGIKDDTLKIATKLFPAAGYQLNKDYVDLARQYFLSDVEGVDFGKAVEAANKINKYVEDNTNNKIHDLISPDSLSDLTKLVIVNAVHFQANWKQTFSTSYDDYFKVSRDEKVMTKMMTQTNFFDYKEDSTLDAKILKMDYEKGGYSMLIILPSKDDGLPALEAKLAQTDLSNLLKDLKETRVEVTIPKFRLEQTHNLKDTLKNMGVKDMFSSRANLNGIASGDNLYVSDVVQKTFINVHENGTEAAAATAVLVALQSSTTFYPPIPVFRADHPFYFVLTKDSVALFTGRLSSPL